MARPRPRTLSTLSSTVVPVLSSRNQLFIWACAAMGGAVFLLLALPITFDWGEPAPGYVGVQIYSGCAALVLLGVSLRRGRQFATLATIMVGAVGALGFIAAVITAVRISRHGTANLAVRAGLLLFAGGALGIALEPDGAGPGSVLGAAVVAALTVAAGSLWASRDRERKEIADLRRDRVRTEERMRIARDIHDSLSHRLSLIAIHSGALEYREDLTAVQVREAVSTIRSQAEEASTDLGDIIGALRIPSSPERTRQSPVDVLAAAREEGREIDTSGGFPSQECLESGLTVSGVAAVDAMLRECLNNASRHAPGTVTSVTGSITGSTLSVSVTNPRTGGRAAGASGYGLLGIAERANLAGGSLEVDETPEFFTVILALPWQGGRP